MNLKAGIEGLVAIAVAIGWAVIKALMSRREDEGAWEDLGKKKAEPPHVPHRQQGAPPPRIPEPGRYSTTPLPRPVGKVPPRQPQIPSTPKPVTQPRPVPQPPPVVLQRDLGRLDQSKQAYARAAALQQKVLTRLVEVERETETARPLSVKNRPQSRAARELLETFRKPETTRQAILASFVLGPPKALESTSGIL